MIVSAVRAYQVVLSPVFSGSCRYTPSCSQYMAEAVGEHGAARGAWLGLRRLARCHPLGGRGFDPVPGVPLPRPRGRVSILETLSGTARGKVR